nr:glycosyltransferase [Ornithinimicrobium sp. F0845]
MIGWAQPVKDPAWALEVLARLRAHDPGWTLVLVGPDFAPGTVTSGREYAARFRERLAAPDVRGGVEFVGATRDLAPHLRSAGFVLSSSRRESFGLGLVEGAASGAVPVVRNWPIFARLDGARGLFPSEWVVDTVEAAVERVLANADEQEWARSSATARDEVERRFLAGDPARALSQLVLGGSAEGPTGS